MDLSRDIILGSPKKGWLFVGAGRVSQELGTCV